MRERRRPVDGFQTASGLLGLLAGPALLLRGAPAGWSILLSAAGLVLLAAEWSIAFDLHCKPTDRTQLALGVAAMALLVVAVVYLTRAADDLPSLFPGHDGDSEQFRILPGVLTLTIGSALFVRAIIAAHPTRSRA